jgi:hypothetical protein
MALWLYAFLFYCNRLYLNERLSGYSSFDVGMNLDNRFAVGNFNCHQIASI